MNTYALTVVSCGRRAIFVRTANAELLLQILFRYRDAKRFALHGFVIMPEHIHILLTPLGENTIERCVQLIKGGFSFAVRTQFPGQVWQNGYHDHRVRDGKDFANQLQYIAENPARRGLTEHLYVHSSFADRMDLMPKALIT
jgi:putative transposase